MNDIGTWFLVLSLFLPRITLFFWWLAGNLPANTTPFWGDVFTAILIPRILIIVWIFNLQGASVWFWIHLGFAALVYLANIIRLGLRYAKS